MSGEAGFLYIFYDPVQNLYNSVVRDTTLGKPFQLVKTAATLSQS